MCGFNFLNKFVWGIIKGIGLTILLDDLCIPYQVYFSGTGFHIGIPGNAFRWKPCPDLHLKVKDELKARGIYEYADPSVTNVLSLLSDGDIMIDNVVLKEIL